MRFGLTGPVFRHENVWAEWGCWWGGNSGFSSTLHFLLNCLSPPPHTTYTPSRDLIQWDHSVTRLFRGYDLVSRQCAAVSSSPIDDVPLMSLDEGVRPSSSPDRGGVASNTQHVYNFLRSFKLLHKWMVDFTVSWQGCKDRYCQPEEKGEMSHIKCFSVKQSYCFLFAITLVQFKCLSSNYCPRSRFYLHVFVFCHSLRQ